MWLALYHTGRTIPTFVNPNDPDSVLDYAVIWDDWLEEGETIVDRVWFAAHITISATATSVAAIINNVTYRAVETVWLRDGEIGRTAIVTCRVTTSKGRIEDRSFRLRIAQT